MENVIIHIAVKGEKGAYIFHDDEDRYLYLRAMSKSSYKFNIKFLAYAILNNHAHFVIMGNKDTVSKFLYSGSRRFGTYYREKYKTSGRLFSGRVTKKYITSEIDLRNVIRYVNMNLVNAGIEKNIGDSIFTSYPAVLSLVPDPFERTEVVDNYTNKEELKFISGTLDIKYILKSFALNKNGAVKNFIYFHKSKDAASETNSPADEEHYMNIAKAIIINEINKHYWGKADLNDYSINNFVNKLSSEKKRKLIRAVISRTKLSNPCIAALMNVSKETVRRVRLSMQLPG